jgi:hypothetical protein
MYVITLYKGASRPLRSRPQPGFQRTDGRTRHAAASRRCSTSHGLSRSPTPSGLRQDRILDEARHTADPVHLIRVFGISDTTAMKYVYAAHPERRSTLPR